MNWTLLGNSLLVSGLATLAALAIGFLAALWLAGVPPGWRRRLLVPAILALMLPPFLVTNCWLDLLSPGSQGRARLAFDLCTRGGAIWILSLLLWPLPLLFALSAWQRLEAAQLECDPALRGWALIRWLLWPMARPALSLAAVLVFVLALNNFTVPAILQVKVLPAEMWILFNTQLDAAEAFRAGWPLVVAPLALLGVLRRAEIRWPSAEGPVKARAVRRQLGPAWSTAGALVLLAALALSLAVPLAQITLSLQTWSEIPVLLRAVPGALGNSFWYAALTALLCVAAGIVTWRWRVGLILWLPFLVPGVLLGILLIKASSRFPVQFLYGGAGMVILAFALRYLAVGWNGVALARWAVDPDLTDAGRLDGAAGWTLFWHVHRPQVAPQLAAAGYVTYLLCLWDVETLLLVCPPGGETLALRVFNLLHYGHTAQVNALCLLLLALAVAPLAAWGMAHWIRTGLRGDER